MRHPAAQRSAPHSPSAPNPGPAAPWDPRVVLGIRLAVAAAVVLCTVAALRHSIRLVETDLVAQRAFLVHKSSRSIAVAGLRKAHEMSPGEPVTMYRLASVNIQTQGMALMNQGPASVDYSEIVEALDMLTRAQRSHHSHHAVVLREGQAAGLLSEYHNRIGDPARARQYASIASDHYYAVRQLLGRPLEEPERHYRAAMEYSIANSRPQLALLHLDDYVYYFGESEITSTPIRQRAVEARYLMGEFHLMMAELATLVKDNPTDPFVLELLSRYATMSHQEKAAILILERLDQQKELDKAGQAVLEALRAG